MVLATYSDGGSYSIQIYTNLKDKSNPVSGTPAFANPVTFYQEHAGISTVEVPEVNLMNGTLYSVVITNIGSDTVEYLCETNSAYDWWSFKLVWRRIRASVTMRKMDGAIFPKQVQVPVQELKLTQEHWATQ